ncbi:hypothetical protein AB0M39_02945 [Streptomyces sp. NPDC051907]|uniref:hypothetical protein n=1 Tax=Streptomyces sp. NPDC051907 TaxID=3155284 RepID=UPI003422748D
MKLNRGSALSALLLTVALVVGISSCAIDRRGEPTPSPATVKASEVMGEWHGWGGSSVRILADGVVEVTLLDGQEFRFDDGWRMTARGKWQLYGPGEYRGGNTAGNGSVVQLRVKPSEAPGKSQPSSTGTSEVGAEAVARTADPPAEAVWSLGVIRDRDDKLALFFLTSDPDARDYYYLSRKEG